MDEQFAVQYKFLVNWLMATAARLFPGSPGEAFLPWAGDLVHTALQSEDVAQAWSNLANDKGTDRRWIVVTEMVAFQHAANSHAHAQWAPWNVSDRTRDFLIDMAHTILGSLEHTLKNLTGGAAIILNALKELAEAFKHIVNGRG